MKTMYMIIGENVADRKEAAKHPKLVNEPVWYVSTPAEARRAFDLDVNIKGVFYKEYWNCERFWEIIAEIYCGYLRKDLNPGPFMKALSDSYKGIPTKLHIKNSYGLAYIYIGMDRADEGKIAHGGVSVTIQD